MDYVIVTKDELAHHGIKGQKWGVRRFQNKDGSLTSAGRKRYDTGSATEGSSTGGEKRKGLTDKQKTLIKAGIAATAIALVAYGTYKAAKSGKITEMAEKGKSVTVKMLEKMKNQKNKLPTVKDLKRRADATLAFKPDDKFNLYRTKHMSTKEIQEANARAIAVSNYLSNNRRSSTIKKGLATVAAISGAASVVTTAYNNANNLKNIAEKEKRKLDRRNN